MKKIIPEIDEIVKFYSPETIEQIARETGFVQRESKFGGTEFLGIMTAGLFAEPDASLARMAAMAKDINPDIELGGFSYIELTLYKAAEDFGHYPLQSRRRPVK